MPTIEARSKRTQWFQKDRFGMFIHWGLYSIPAKGEWFMTNQKMPKEEYMKYFYEFDPINYEPKKWAKLAKEAGMKYAVMTAKHHDGFCLFDSKYTDYKATNTKAKRDLIKEYIDAFREEGLKVGLYYSLIDWYHDDFPHYGDKHHPMRDNKDFKYIEHDFHNYLEYMHNQIEELCTNYGKIDILWFDFGYDQMTGEKWKATELINMVRKYQPHVIIDDRLEVGGDGSGSILTKNPNIYAGDFASPEQMIPPEGILNELGEPVPWEACITMNNHWGYSSTDRLFKTPKMLIRKLVECVSKNGNMLLNVGPNAKGEIPSKSIEILEEIGRWMKDNSSSIYNSGISQFHKPEWGYYTQNGNTLYAHIFEPPIGALAIEDKEDRIISARLLSDKSEIDIVKPWNTMDYDDYKFINFGSPPQLTYRLPDNINTVIELKLNDK